MSRLPHCRPCSARGVVFHANASDVTGAGASFVYPAVSKWSSDYKAATGKEVNYQSIGSGGGIAQIKSKPDLPTAVAARRNWHVQPVQFPRSAVVPTNHRHCRDVDPDGHDDLPRQDHPVERPVIVAVNRNQARPT